MPNVLIIQDTDWIERGPHQQHHIFERLGHRGYSIYVVDFEILWDKKQRKSYFQKKKEFRNISHVIEDNNIEVIRPPILKIPLLDKITIPLFHALAIKRLIKRKKIQVIVGQTILNTLCGLALSKIYRVPFIYHVIDSIHSLTKDYIPRYFSFLAKILEIIIIRFSNVIITINKELKNYILNLGGNPKKTFIVPAGVDLKRYQNLGNRNKIRKNLGIKEEDFVLFFMGWLYHFSGLRELADYIINHPNLKIKLLAVGDGDLFPYLSALSKKSDSIITTGRVPFEEIPDYLSAADVCILPAHRNEIMMHIVPIKIYEYMAAAKPVITTNLPGIFREFGKGNGVLYCRDIEQLIHISLKIRKNNELNLIGQKGLKFVESHDWDLLVKNFEKRIIQTIKSHNQS